LTLVALALTAFLCTGKLFLLGFSLIAGWLAHLACLAKLASSCDSHLVGFLGVKGSLTFLSCTGKLFFSNFLDAGLAHLALPNLRAITIAAVI
jgi:hypothetical protein